MNESQILNEQLTWHRNAKQGCVFASSIANNPPLLHLDPDFWIRSCILSNSKDLIQSNISQLLQAAIDNPNNQMLSILLPSITAPKDLIFLFEIIKDIDGWKIYFNEGIGYDSDNYTLVRIKAPIKGRFTAENQQVYSWLLGFGNFDFFPKTRQSPYTEIVFVTKSKQELAEIHRRFSIYKQFENSVPRKGEEASAHLADMFLDGITNNPEKDTLFWENTGKLKRHILNNDGNDDRAKAKVTFTIPSDYLNPQT